MRGEERGGGRNKPFCGPGSSAIAGGPEDAPACTESAEATPAADATGAVDAATDDTPPPPEAKPAEGPTAPAAEKPKKAKTKPASQSAKRTFKREVNRLRRFFSD